MDYFPADKGNADQRRVFNLLERIELMARDGQYRINVNPCRDKDGNESVRLWMSKLQDGRYAHNRHTEPLPVRMVPLAFYRRRARRLARKLNKEVRILRGHLVQWRAAGIRA